MHVQTLAGRKFIEFFQFVQKRQELGQKNDNKFNKFIAKFIIIFVPKFLSFQK